MIMVTRKTIIIIIIIIIIIMRWGWNKETLKWV